MLLSGFANWGLRSRNFMLDRNAQHLKRVIARKGKYSRYSDEQVAFVEARTTMETVERTCQMLEDFCALTNGLSGSLIDFPKKLLLGCSPETWLGKMDRATWNRVLRYRPIEDLGLPRRRAEFLARVREQNFQRLVRFAEVMRDFVSLYWIPYTKHKHAMTMIYGIESIPIERVDTLVVPVVYNSRTPSKMKALLIREDLRRDLRGLYNVLYSITGDVIARNVAFIERGGVGFSEYSVFGKLTVNDRRRLRKLIREIDGSVYRLSIELRMEIEIGPETIKRHRDVQANIKLLLREGR